jgi:hypothetical protein
MRAKLRSDMLEPRWRKSRTLREDPSLATPYVESADPKRKNPRIEQAEPNETKSSTARLDPSRCVP